MILLASNYANTQAPALLLSAIRENLWEIETYPPRYTLQSSVTLQHQYSPQDARDINVEVHSSIWVCPSPKDPDTPSASVSWPSAGEPQQAEQFGVERFPYPVVVEGVVEEERVVEEEEGWVEEEGVGTH